MAKLTFQYINRRLHLYLGMFCLPWFLMYGITSLAFNHPTWLNDGKGQAGGQWDEVASWPCAVVVPETGDIPKETTRELFRVAGMHPGAFGSYRSGANRIHVYIPSFRKMRQLVYHVDEQRLALEKRKKFARQFLTGLHARGGFTHDSFPNDAWAFLVDVVCTAFLLWVVSGLIMWWRVPQMRVLGALALLAGILSFAGFMAWL